MNSINNKHYTNSIVNQSKKHLATRLTPLRDVFFTPLRQNRIIQPSTISKENLRTIFELFRTSFNNFFLIINSGLIKNDKINYIVDYMFDFQMPNINENTNIETYKELKTQFENLKIEIKNLNDEDFLNSKRHFFGFSILKNDFLNSKNDLLGILDKIIELLNKIVLETIKNFPFGYNINHHPQLQKSNEVMEIEVYDVLKDVHTFWKENNIFKDNTEILGLLNEFKLLIDNIKTKNEDKETYYGYYKSLKEIIEKLVEQLVSIKNQETEKNETSFKLLDTLFKVDFFLTQVIENYEDAKRLEMTDIKDNINRMKRSLESRLGEHNYYIFMKKKNNDRKRDMENTIRENIVKNTTRVLTDVLKKSLFQNQKRQAKLQLQQFLSASINYANELVKQRKKEEEEKRQTKQRQEKQEEEDRQEKQRQAKQRQEKQRQHVRNVQNLTMNKKNNDVQTDWTKTLQQINTKSILNEEEKKIIDTFTMMKKRLNTISKLIKSVTEITDKIRYFTQLRDLLTKIKTDISNLNLTIDEVNNTILDEQINNTQIVIDTYTNLIDKKEGK